MKMSNTLNAVGIGPGDPELITIKAINAVKNSGFIFYPSVSAGSNKFAYDTIKSGLEIFGYNEFSKREELFIPLEVEMKKSRGRNALLYKENALKVLEKLKHADCSFITIGDPMFYSTFWGLYDAIKKECGRNIPNVNIINGISSFNYALGLIGFPIIIKNSSVFISVPVKKDEEEIIREIKFIGEKSGGSRPNVIVFMKAGAFVENILGAFRKSYADEFKNGNLKFYLIEKSRLIENFIDGDMNINMNIEAANMTKRINGTTFDYFSIFIGVFV